MQRCLVLLLLALTTVVNAHFQLQFPPPRGEFDEDNEPKFCDGFNQARANRTAFPLTGGIFSLNSEHPKFTTGVIVSTAANPTSFDNFSELKPFFQTNGEGKFCFPLNFPSNFTAGQNVTIQVVFDGGDGNLYQCADLTLSSDANVSNIPCSNATGNSNAPSGPSSSTSGGASSTSPGGPAASQTQSGGAIREMYSAGAAGLLLALWGLLTLNP